MSDLIQRMAALSPEKRDLLLKELHKTERSASLQGPKRSGATSAPLSFAQQRLWFLQQLQPENPFYNNHLALRIQGDLQSEILKKSFQEIVRRHEVLRSTVSLDDQGIPMQLVHPDCSVEIHEIHLAHLPENQRLQEAQRRIDREVKRPFDLSHCPLFKITLLSLSAQDTILQLIMHHFISDGWSIGLLMDELSTLYQQFVKQQPSSLPELPVQYLDFSLWQHEQLQGSTLAQQLSYWHEQLSGELPILQLPTDHSRPSNMSYRGATCSFEIPAVLFDGFKQLNQAEGTTLFMSLLAAFEVLLYRYSNQEDLIIGTPVANRTHTEVTQLIGFFVNTLVLRADLSGDPPFRVVLQRVKEVTLGALAHQDTPFEKLVEELQPERSLSFSPLFQVMFVLQNAFGDPLQIPGLSIQPLEADDGTAKFDLTLELIETKEGLQGIFEYSLDLFAAKTIQALVTHFLTLLQSIVATPEEKISRLPLLPEQEREQLIFKQNTTYQSIPQKCFPQLFEEQVAQTPEAIALISAQGQITYNDLNLKINKLAHYLKSLGVGSETCVGVCLERSPELIITMFAILKAGGVYVPLDATYPHERLTFMLANAQVALLLTQKHLPLHDDHIPTFYSEEYSHLIDQQNSKNPERNTHAKNAAYIIFTSGSTGKPKGVVVSHQGIANLAAFQQATFDVQPGYRVLQFASLSFDASVWEIMMALLSGATLCLGTQEDLQPGLNLFRYLKDLSITIVTLPPSVLATIMDEDLPDLKVLVSAGEACTSELIERWSSKHRFFNAYGPTELTICATTAICTEGSKPALGQPIYNTQVYILDASMQPVPFGAVGELYLAGVGMARGYLNRTDLTAERFLPDPFSSEPGSRLYKTGDLGCYRNGSIEYLGRLDHQVKLRGYRIELGEIEALLAQHQSVQQALVLPTQNAKRETQLVAYIVRKPTSIKDPSYLELRHYLQKWLPDYMLPVTTILLEHFPLLPNGKLDRLALPTPELEKISSDVAYVSPRTPTEEICVQVWTSLLNLQKIGIHDNFFVVGGHSLIATQVMARICTLFSVNLPIRTLFETPTIASLAQRIDHLKQTEAGGHQQAIPPYEKKGNIPLSYAQERLWFLNQLESTGASYNIPFVMRFKGDLHTQILVKSLDEIIRRHETLRTTFPTEGGVPRQVIAPPQSLDLPLEDLRQAVPETCEEKVQCILEQEAQASFDLAQGPLLRIRLLRISDQEYLLLLNMHHIIADGWSITILLHEIATLYKAFAVEEPSPLPPLPIQYTDFALWQRAWLQGDILTQQLTYWREQLAGELPVLQLPTDRPRPMLQNYQGATCSFTLAPDLMKQLQELSQRENVTLFMTCLAAFQTLLFRYTNQEDILIGTPIANRTKTEIENLIGFFVNTQVLRTKIVGTLTFREVLQRVREVALGAYMHQDVPFEKLVDELSPTRDLSHNPFFQVMFVFEHAQKVQEHFLDLAIEPVPVHTGTAKFDLTLFLSEETDQIAGTFEYSTALFEAETIFRMIEHFQQILTEIVTHPNKPISTFHLLSQKEEHLLLREWNRAEQHYPHHQCIHHLFEEHALKTPEAIALVYGEEQLTYQELNARANQLAHYLQKLGVTSETLVGLCIERSLEMIISLLGVLKAGGAYVPIDPEYPEERQRFILQDSNVDLLLTQEHLRPKFPQQDIQLICLDTDWEMIEQESRINLEKRVIPQNLAYIIYTSGSTGMPKGCLITHQNVMRLFEATSAWFQFTRQDVWSLFHSYAFDFSVWEIWGALLYGGRLVIVPYWISRSAEAFYHLLCAEKITVLNQTPSAFYQLMRVDETSEERSNLALHTIIFGGEALNPQFLRNWFDRHDPSVKLINMYGITETTVHVTYTQLQADDHYTSVKSNIGRPLPDLQIYILDQDLRPVPIGVAGEIYVGGDGLARGYLHRADLTATRFVPDPFSRTSGTRLYKTGDLARYLANGTIEYLGRNDHQVKIRGFRIELEEIEMALAKHSALHEVVVTVREDIPGDKRLVAYVIPNQQPAPTSKNLRSYLKKQLPDYMLPMYFVALDSLPLTNNGKINQKALPDPSVSSSSTEPVTKGTSTEVEHQIISIWQEILHIENVDIQDNFFDLGGNSLLIIQVRDKLQQVLNKKVSILDLFKFSTIHSLTEFLSEEQDEPSTFPLYQDRALKQKEVFNRQKYHMQRKTQKD